MICGAMASDPTISIEALRAHLKEGTRLIGLDLGTKTIGLALSDSGLRFASPHGTIKRTKFTKDAADLLEICSREHVGAIVLDFPENLDFVILGE